MIIVDDRLGLEALAGRLGTPEEVATTWGFHYRLVRALEDEARWGALNRLASEQLRQIAANPPEARLQVLDPRTVTAEAARVAVRHGLNVLAAELVASAVHYRASVRLSEANVGRRWPEVMAAEGVALQLG